MSRPQLSGGALVPMFAAALLLAAACAPAPAAQSTAKPAGAATAAPTKPTTAPAASPAAKAAASPAASPAAKAVASPATGPAAKSANADWQVEWDRVVAAAKQEGKLVLSGPPGELWRNALTAFSEEYPEIQVEYTGANSRDFWPRLLKEREVGQYLWDLRVGGPDPQTYQAQADGVLEPVRPLLMLPEVRDDSKWLGGLDGLFVDTPEEYQPGFLAYARTTIFVNRDVIPASELQSQEQLLDPKWRGKIVLQDPRGGAGLGVLSVLVGAYGEPFVRELLTKQDVVVTGDNRQQAEWVVRGRYPIGIGLAQDQLEVFRQQGLQFNVDKLGGEAVGLNIGFGAIQLLNKAPHPNAAKVFINWLLTQETQRELSQAVIANSRRLDVPPVVPDEQPDPTRLDKYYAHQEQAYLHIREKTLELAEELIK